MLDDDVLAVLDVESDISCCSIYGIAVLISTAKYRNVLSDISTTIYHFNC